MSQPLFYGRLIGALKNSSGELNIDIPLVSKTPTKSVIPRAFDFYLLQGDNQLGLGLAPTGSLTFKVLLFFPKEFPLEFVTLKGLPAHTGIKTPSKDKTMIFSYDQTAVGAGNFNFYINVPQDVDVPVEVIVI